MPQTHTGPYLTRLHGGFWVLRCVSIDVGTSDARCDEAGRAFLKVADPFTRVPPFAAVINFVVHRIIDSSSPRVPCYLRGETAGFAFGGGSVVVQLYVKFEKLIVSHHPLE